MTDAEEKALRSAFADLRGQMNQVSVTMAEIKRILDGDAEAIQVPDYAGPINVGDHFVWLGDHVNGTPKDRSAWQHLIVTKVLSDESWSERKIWTKRADGRPVGGYPPMLETWNDEGRFREACLPCDERGSIKQ